MSNRNPIPTTPSTAAMRHCAELQQNQAGSCNVQHPSQAIYNAYVAASMASNHLHLQPEILANNLQKLNHTFRQLQAIQMSPLHQMGGAFQFASLTPGLQAASINGNLISPPVIANQPMLANALAMSGLARAQMHQQSRQGQPGNVSIPVPQMPTKGLLSGKNFVKQQSNQSSPLFDVKLSSSVEPDQALQPIVSAASAVPWQHSTAKANSTCSTEDEDVLRANVSGSEGEETDEDKNSIYRRYNTSSKGMLRANKYRTKKRLTKLLNGVGRLGMLASSNGLTSSHREEIQCIIKKLSRRHETSEEVAETLAAAKCVVERIAAEAANANTVSNKGAKDLNRPEARNAAQTGCVKKSRKAPRSSSRKDALLGLNFLIKSAASAH